MSKKPLFLSFLLLYSISSTCLARWNPRIIATINVKSDFKSRPTFYGQTPKLINRNKMLYLGRTAQWDKDYIYLYDLRTKKKIRKKVPLKQFFSRNKHLLINNSLVNHRNRKAYYFKKLFFYDTTNEEAGIEVINSPRFRQNQIFLLIWDLRTNKFKRCFRISKKSPYKWYTYIIGYNHITKTCYFALRGINAGSAPQPKLMRLRTGQNNDNDSDNENRNDKRYDSETDKDGDSDYEPIPRRRRAKYDKVLIFSQQGEKIKKITRFTTRNKMHRIYFFRKNMWCMITEYTERATGKPGYGYLVRLASGKVKRMNIPHTAYGVALAPSGKRIYIASSQTGYLWAVNTTTGRRIKKVFCYQLGHTLGFVKKNQLLWLRNFALHFFQTPSLKKSGYIGIGQLYKGFSHVEGSLILPGKAIIKNGKTIYIVKF